MVTPRHGVEWLGPDKARFRVWAPKPKRLELLVEDRSYRLDRDASGFGELVVPARPGMRYAYGVNGNARPDPASPVLPDGVHGRGELWDPRFEWTDAAYRSRPLAEWAIYELHVGTFSREGTFDGVASRLDYLRDLGITAVELMPVAPFPGNRNWGYDGVSFQAVHAGYGGPRGLQRLVDAAHARGLAVVLDVVFNHLGPEGNYLPELGPYFSERHHTPWGPGLNVDGPDGRPVRDLILESGLRWFEEFHVDALRLDAVHGIVDDSPMHLIAELEQRSEELSARLGRSCTLIAEYDLGESKVVRPRSEGGWQLPAQWCDDFHHALHARLTGERHHYYVDFGSTAQVATALRQGYVYTGQPSVFRKRAFGTPTADLPPERFVVFNQNHDQIGNRALGERLNQLVEPAKVRLAAAVVLLAPQVPLIFMGDEYGEPAPFLYFTSHGDPGLARAVSEGRRREFPDFDSAAEQIPDPQAVETFERSRVDLERRKSPGHAPIYALYSDLLALRRRHPVLRSVRPEVEQSGECVIVTRTLPATGSTEPARAVLVACFQSHGAPVPAAAQGMHLAVDTEEARYGGRGGDPERLAPWSARLYLAPNPVDPPG